jgi:hypothetical protein
MKVMLLKYRRKISERFQTLFWSVTNTKDESLHPAEKAYGRIVDDEMRHRCLHGHITLEAKLTPRKKKFGYKGFRLRIVQRVVSVRKVKKLWVVLPLVLLLSLAIFFLPSFFASIPAVYALQGIARVQGNCKAIITTSKANVTMTSTPTSGDVLVLTFGAVVLSGSTVTLSSISQAGVTWSKILNRTITYYDTEIWFGVVGSGAVKNVTLTLSGSPNTAYADACEYSGIATSSYLDKTASTNCTLTGSNTANTGTTATTTQASELWIGSIMTAGSGATQSAATNGFTLLDGKGGGSIGSEAYLEKIVSSIGAANSGTTISTNTGWVGCIATFKASSSTTKSVEYQIDLFGGNKTSACDNTTSTSYAMGARSGIVLISSSKFVNPKYYFEAVLASSSSSGTAYAELYDYDSSAAVSGSPVSVTGTTITRVRSGAVTLTTNHQFVYYYYSSSSSCKCCLYAARIIVVDNITTGWTASESQVDMGGYNKTMSTVASNLQSQPIYRYNSSVWSPSPTIYFEAALKTSSNTTGGASAELYCVNSSSYITTVSLAASSSSTTETRERSYSITLTSGDLYEVKVDSTVTGYTAYIYDAKLIIDQSGTLTKTELYRKVAGTQTSTSTSYVTCNNQILLNQTNLVGNCTFYYWMTIKSSSTSYTAYSELYDMNTTSLVTGSNMSTTSNSWTLLKSGSMIPATNNHQVVGEIKESSASGTCSIASAWLVIDFVSTAPTTFSLPRVQGNARGTSLNATSFKVTLTSTPISGDVIVLTFGDYYMLGSVVVKISSISQTGVTWAKVINSTFNDGGWGDSEIWFGVVGSGASKNVTLTLSGSPTSAVADACEYSGVATSNYVDKTAINSGDGTPSDTGTTATTTQANELWIGSIAVASDTTQSNPTNGFTLLDGNYYGLVSEAYLEKIVPATGTADSGTTLDMNNAWAGCIATFKAASTGYPLNLRVQDWLQDDNIQGAYVYENTSVKTSDANGWANWTGLSGTVQIKVKYYGFWVNGTFSVSMTSSQTINVRCKLYDITVKTVTNVTSTHQALLDGTNVTCFNATSGGTQIATGTTETGGTYQFLTLPNNTLTIICRGGSSWSKILLNTTLNVNTVGSQGSQTIVCTQNYLSTSSTDIIVAVVKSH